MFFLLILYVVPVFRSAGLERTISLGREIEENKQWKDLILDGLTMRTGKWNTKDLILKDGEYSLDGWTDLLIHFNGDSFRDESGNYKIAQETPLLSKRVYVLGDGAAAFQSDQNVMSLVPMTRSIFDGTWRDFSLEFWLYPVTLNNHEVILSWAGTQVSGENIISQKLECLVSDRKIAWNFENFFGKDSDTHFSLPGITRLIPRSWHHHLLHFDSATGMLEYLVDGTPEGIIYATETGHDGGSVLLPSTSIKSKLLIGGQFTGLIDELRLSQRFVKDPLLTRFTGDSGFGISRIFDMEHLRSRLKNIESTYNTPPDTAVYYYYRVFNTLEKETAGPWVRFEPNQEFQQELRGRFLQLKLRLMPDGSGMNTPSVSDIKIVYEPALPPTPPSFISAAPGNRKVTLRWQKVKEKYVGGYKIYYGDAPGQYLGTGCLEGNSPITVKDIDENSNQISFTLTGFENGRLYYFSVVTYDSYDSTHQSIFSREVSARPSEAVP